MKKVFVLVILFLTIYTKNIFADQTLPLLGMFYGYYQTAQPNKTDKDGVYVSQLKGGGVLARYDLPGVRDTIKNQLAQMKHDGVEAIRINLPVWNTIADPEMFKDIDPRTNWGWFPADDQKILEPYRTNIANYSADVKAAGFEHFMISYGAAWPNKMAAADRAKRDFPMLVDILDLMHQNGPSDIKIDLYGEGVPSDFYPQDQKNWMIGYSSEILKLYYQHYGKNDAVVSFIANGAHIPSMIKNLLTIYKNANLTPPWIQFSLYPDPVTEDNTLAALNSIDNELKSANLSIPILIEETFYGSEEVARGVNRFMATSSRPILWLFQWPILTDSTTAPAPPYNINTYKKYLKSEAISFRKPISVNSSLTGSNPASLVDNNPSTFWSSGQLPTPNPQWATIDLGSEQTIEKVKLFVSQYPDGNTTHELWVAGNNQVFTKTYVFSGITKDGDVLEHTFSPPLTSVRYVKVQTTQSPSWVAWREIEVYKSSLPLNPSSSKIAARNDGITLFNGQPFFPVGLFYWFPDDSPTVPTDHSGQIHTLKDAGFNTVFLGGNRSDLSYLDQAQNLGLKVVNYNGIFNNDANYIKAIENHPSLLAWYGIDEPISINLCNWNQTTKTCTFNDSNPSVGNLTTKYSSLWTNNFNSHPIWTIYSMGETNEQIRAWHNLSKSSIGGIDIYPAISQFTNFCAKKNISCVGEMTDKIVATLGSNKPIWMGLQGFTTSPEGYGGVPPSLTQTRFMAYDSIVHGATGIFWWDYGLKTSDDMWRSLKLMATELTDANITPALLGTNRQISQSGPVKILSTDDVSEKYKYKIAVNETTQPAGNYTVSGFTPNSDVYVLVENRTIKADTGGNISDHFDDWSVHLYRQETQGTPLSGDLNNDNKVDINDYNQLIINGNINIFDFNRLISNFGKTQ